MTNHIERLMKAAEVRCKLVTDYELNEYNVYPDLTPEKQLELIKLVLKKPYIEWEQYFEHGKFIMKANMPNETYACLTVDIKNTEYAFALAEFITELLKIKRLDKSEVRRILQD